MSANPTLPRPETTPSYLEEMEKKHRSIPMEAVLKQDILRLGITFEEETLTKGTFKQKDYFIFSFDHVPVKEQSESIRFKVPEEIKIKGGHFQILPTVVSVRVNPASPYKVTCHPSGGEPHLMLCETDLGHVEFPPVPSWYAHRSVAGKSPGEIAPVIEWGYLIYLTIFRNCQYFGKDEECAYCDINHNYRQQRAAGRPYTGVKNIDEILETLAWIDAEDTVAECYTLTGGSVVTELHGMKEHEFYLKYARAIEERFPKRWMGKVVTQAWEKKHLYPLKESGIRIYHPNFEVWDKNLFQALCPGKERFVGRDEWNRRIIDSADVFGPSCVIPNFVAGIELSTPHGFTTIEEAIRSTGEGLDYFMRHGVVPRFTAWCPEPYTTLGVQSSPPLEYFCRLLEVWKETFEKYSLPVPQGYGNAGVGRAVFSVSAFMDVIGYRGR